MPLQQLVLSAGAALALGSLAIVAMQEAGAVRAIRPDEALLRAALAAQAGLASVAFQPRAAAAERRIEMLRQSLLLESAPPEWGRLAMVLRANAQLLDAALERRPRGRDTPAVEMMRAQADIAAARAQALHDLLPALRSLYVVMTPEQRRAADRVFRTGPLAAGTAG